MVVEERTGARRDLEDIQSRLRPDEARAQALSRLEELFASGRVPDPQPDGFLRGRLLTTSVGTTPDGFLRRVAGVYMPWLGKSFDPASQRGVNVLTKKARGPMRVLWPNYVPERDLADRIEAFPFRTRVGPAEVDPGVDVLKIDYDFDANPALVIRRILDELVQIDDGLYLGKVLMRRSGSWAAVGFFSLER